MHLVAYWPITPDIALEPDVAFRGTADIVLSGALSALVANDPSRKWPDVRVESDMHNIRSILFRQKDWHAIVHFGNKSTGRAVTSADLADRAVTIHLASSTVLRRGYRAL
jgi:hypothetical protein